MHKAEFSCAEECVFCNFCHQSGYSQTEKRIFVKRKEYNSFYKDLLLHLNLFKALDHKIYL